MNNLAGLLESKGDYDGAEPLYRRALEARERVLGREHPDTLASVNNLAALLYSKGDYDGAEPLYRRALEARERVLGREHPDTLGSVRNLAALLTAKVTTTRPSRCTAAPPNPPARFSAPTTPSTKLFAENHADCLAAMRAKPAP